MSAHTTQIEQPPLEALPQDLWAHLQGMDPRAHAFGEDMQALNELAHETGHRVLTLADVFPPVELTPPAGYSCETILSEPIILGASQFEGRIHSLSRDSGKSISVEAHELVTDMGSRIAVCDLRGLMTNSVKEGGPSEKGEDVALDRAIMNDIKFFADQGHARKSVTGVKGVYYSRVNGTKIRGYWTALTPETPLGMPVVGRLADCGNSPRAEEDLYRRVFDKTVSL